MEIMIAWFWLVKVFIFGVTAAIIYLYFQTKKKRYLYALGIAVLLLIATPVKLQPTTSAVVKQMNYQIEQRNIEIPPKIVDNSFEKDTNLTGITPEDTNSSTF